MAYDCTGDVLEHQAIVGKFLNDIAEELSRRANSHDASKLRSPEKETFDEWKPRLERETFGTPEYESALRRMGDGLQAHFTNNRHHPEHFPRGVSDMTLVDVVEMLCDWLAVAERKGSPPSYEYLSKRFSIGSQLLNILENTERELTNPVVGT